MTHARLGLWSRHLGAHYVTASVRAAETDSTRSHSTSSWSWTPIPSDRGTVSVLSALSSKDGKRCHSRNTWSWPRYRRAA